jgi:uncharacterized protein (DUF2141 family)
MRIAGLALAVALAVGTATALNAQSGDAQSGNRISVPIEGLRNNQGMVRCGLYASADGFRQPGKEFRGVAVPIAGQRATCVFDAVPAGTYAVAVFHAENNETQLKTNLFGQPEEGYGFSRNPSTTFGAPDFGDAAYAYKGGTVAWPVQITY